MAYFDFPEPVNFRGTFSGLTNTLQRRRELELEEARNEANRRFMEAQARQAAEGGQFSRLLQNKKLEQETAERSARGKEALVKHLEAGGSLGGAQALGSSYGIRVDRPGAAPGGDDRDPGAPASDAASAAGGLAALVGGRPSREEFGEAMRSGAQERGLEGMAEAGHAYLDRTAPTQRTAATAPVVGGYRMRTPEGGEFTVDLSEKRRRAEADAEAEVERRNRLLAGAPLTQEQRSSIAIQALLTPAERGQVGNIMAQKAQQEFTAGESEKYRLTAKTQEDLARQRIAKPSGARFAGEKEAKKKATAQISEKRGLEIDQEYWDAGDKVLARHGFTAQVKDRQKILDLSTQVAGAKDNSALAAIIAGAFTKYAQGGAGVLTDHDIKMFWGKIGGVKVRTWQSARDILDGKLDPEKYEIVKEAIDTLVASGTGRENAIGESLVSRLSTMSGSESKVGAILKTHVPAYAKKWDEARRKQLRVE